MEKIELWKIGADGTKQLFGVYDDPIEFAYDVWLCSKMPDISDIMVKRAEDSGK